jgi:hypothetical protein
MDMASYSKKLIPTLWAGLLGGGFGVLVDLDHLPILGASRAAHIPLFAMAGIVGFYSLACLTRLWLEMVLKEKYGNLYTG